MSTFSFRILSRNSAPPPSKATECPFASREEAIISIVFEESYSSKASSGASAWAATDSLRSNDNPIRIDGSFCPELFSAPAEETFHGHLLGIVFVVRVAVAELAPLVVLQNQFAFRLGDDVVRQQRDFTTAVRQVNDEVGYSQPRGMPAHAFHYLQSGLDRRPQVFRALHLVALEEVVRTDFYLKQALTELQLGIQVIVHAVKQNGLVIHRHAGAQQHITSLSRFGRQLIWVVEVSIQPDRPVFGEHIAQLFIYTLGQDHRKTCADTDYLDVLYRPDPGDDALQLRGGEGQRGAARDNDVSHFLGPAHIVNHSIDFFARPHPAAVTPLPLTGTVTAEHRTDIRKHHQRPIGITVHKSGDCRILFFRQRVFDTHLTHRDFENRRNGLLSHRVVRVGRIDKREIVRGDSEGGTHSYPSELRLFLDGQWDELV